MAFFKFRALNAKTGKQIKAEIYLGGIRRGFTQDKRGACLIVETSQTGSFSWYAIYGGRKIDSGNSPGGSIDIIYSENN